MGNNRPSPRFIPVLYIAASALIIGIAFSIQGFTDNTDGHGSGIGRMPSMNQAFEIPSSLDFAGEAVPLNNYDVRESLDREMLANGYFHSRTLLLLKKSKRYFAVIEPILKQYRIPDDFKFLAMVESDLDNLVSPAGATGVWQLMASTAKQYGLEVNAEVDERYDLKKSTEAACKYLLESYEAYGSWTMAAASYNAGRKGMDAQIDIQRTSSYYDLLLNDETARYIYRVLAHKLIAENPEDYGFHVESGEFYPVIQTYEVAVDTAISNIADFAVARGVNYKILKQFNPWMRQNYLPDRSQKVYHISIPQPGQRSFE